jgi:hypothetical protein
MLYLLDANVLITAHNLYYPIDAVPEFWAWLVHKGGTGDLKMPLENYEEVKDGSTDDEKDLLFGWIKTAEVKTAILLEEECQRRSNFRPPWRRDFRPPLLTLKA